MSAGMASILSPDGTSTIGFVEFRQHRRGDVLEVVRIARFSDGSNDVSGPGGGGTYGRGEALRTLSIMRTS